VDARTALPEGSKRYITLRGGPAANSVNIEVENSSARKSHLLDGLPATSKADKAMHGFGLRSVRSVVERYNGVMNIEQNDSSYSISLMIPKPKN
jgi:sensor histidine kinase regulating citrate/malate metabolism